MGFRGVIAVKVRGDCVIYIIPTSHSLRAGNLNREAGCSIQSCRTNDIVCGFVDARVGHFPNQAMEFAFHQG